MKTILKNTSREGQGCMKGLRVMLLLIFFSVVLIGNITAFEFDNTFRYSNEDMKVELINWFGLGTNYGTAELKSHNSVNQIRPVKVGDSVLMWYSFSDFSELYLDGLGEVEIINMDNGEIIKRDYEFVYLGKETYEVDNYICDSNIQVIEEQCIKFGKRNETKEGWLSYNSRNIPKEDIIIGLKMNILPDETLDLVWKIGGKKIEKHAVVSSGAVETIVGGEIVLTYINNGTFNVTADINVSILVVAGGGGASSGGGGAGEVLNDSSFLVTTGNYNITIGTGGNGTSSAAASTAGNDGLNSSFSTLDARGGGGGGENSVGGDGIGQPGGSGGGGGATGGGTNAGGTGDQGDGGSSFNGGVFPSGGGGGSISDGTDGLTGAKGLGGNGTSLNINGTTTIYGIGGDGTINAGNQGANATAVGQGGEGGGAAGSFFGGNGADGIVIIRFGILLAAPNVTLNSPVNNSNFSVSAVEFNATAFDEVNLINVSLVLDGVVNETNSTGINNSIYIFNKFLSDGVHNWTVRAANNESGVTTAEVMYFTIDSTDPVLTISFPTNISYTDSFTNTSTGNSTLNWTTIDDNLDTCWYSNFTSGLNVTVTCGNNVTFNSISYATHRFDVYANDSFGNEGLATVTATYNFSVLQNGVFFNTQTMEGSTEDFIIDFNITSALQISQVDLIYNLTSETGSFLLLDTDRYNGSNSKVIPGVSADTNITFYWSILLSDLNRYNSSNFNQSVDNIGVDNCGTNTNLFYNFTSIDEANQTNITQGVQIEVDVNVTSINGLIPVIQFSQVFDDINPVQVCLSDPILESTNYSVNTIVRYQATNYANEYYNIRNFTLANSTIPQQINLFDLLLTDSTEFRITFKGDDFLPVEGALVFINRQYISENNVFKTVELPITDSNGQTVVHLVQNEVIYNILVTNGSTGRTLGTFNNLNAFCEDATIGDCEINLNALSTSEEIFKYDDKIKIGITDPVFNFTTRLLSFNFVTLDGSTKTVRLESNKSDILGNTTACSTSLTSSSGTLSCTVPEGLGNTTIGIFIYVDGVLVIQDYASTDNTGFGDEGIFILFLMILLMVTMFSESKSMVLLSAAVGLMAGIGLSLINGKLIGIGSSVIFLIIVILIGLWKLNKEKLQ